LANRNKNAAVDGEQGSQEQAAEGAPMADASNSLCSTRVAAASARREHQHRNGINTSIHEDCLPQWRHFTTARREGKWGLAYCCDFYRKTRYTKPKQIYDPFRTRAADNKSALAQPSGKGNLFLMDLNVWNKRLPNTSFCPSFGDRIIRHRRVMAATCGGNRHDLEPIWHRLKRVVFFAVPGARTRCAVHPNDAHPNRGKENEFVHVYIG
jgi:hypothetical protein